MVLEATVLIPSVWIHLVTLTSVADRRVSSTQSHVCKKPTKGIFSNDSEIILTTPSDRLYFTYPFPQSPPELLQFGGDQGHILKRFSVRSIFFI